MPGRLPLSLFDNILLFLFYFTLTDSESYTACGVYKSGALIIVLQVEYIQLEQVKYDHRQKHCVVIHDL